VGKLVLVWTLLVNLGLLALFARSLLPRRTALLVRLARHAHLGALSPRHRTYAAVVTWAWTGYFAIAAGVIGLELASAQPLLPPLLLAMGSWPMVLTLLVLEYGIRRLVLPGYDHMSLKAFLLYLTRIDYRVLVRDDVGNSSETDDAKALR
jgi:uncharacterized membrane protein